MKWAVVLCLLLSSCTLKIWDLIPHNTVSFGPGFSEHQKEEIMAGLQIWSRDTGGRIDFVEVPDHGSYNMIVGTEAQAKARDAVANAHLAKGESPHFTLAMTSTEQSNTWMFLDRIENSALNNEEDPDALLRQTAAHEGGHELGLVHVPQNEAALMNPDSNKEIVNDLHLTLYDINQFCQYWGCIDKNPALPLEK